MRGAALTRRALMRGGPLKFLHFSPKKKKKRRRLFLEMEEAGERSFGPEPGEERVFRLESAEIVQEPMQVFYERENTLTEF